MGEVDPGASAEASFDVSERPDATVLRLAGELDLASCDELEPALRDVVAGVKDRLVIDATDLRFADSSAIAMWVRWRDAVPALEIHNPPPIVRRVIQTMGLAEVLGLS